MILHGDSLHILKELPDNSVDSVVTDPPYGLSFMGKKWDYDVPTTDLWREVFRVLKPGGHLLSFFGTRTYHRGVVRIEDAGFEIRDQIQWIYGSGFPKSHNIKEGEYKGWGTALKPANEPIVLARKPISEKTIAQNVLRWGTGAINVDACRIGMQKAQTYSAPDIRGNAFNSDVSHKDRHIINAPAQGRWPANILFDEEAAEILDAQSGPCKTGGRNIKTKCGQGFFKVDVDQTLAPDIGSGASRFFYVAKASKRERNKGCEGLPEVEIKGDVSLRSSGAHGQTGKPNKPGQTGKPNKPIVSQNHHPTVKPIKLMQYLIKLITPPNGTVLDPFAGSGSTLVAAKSLNFKFIGIELNKEYVEIAERRIEALA